MKRAILALGLSGALLGSGLTWAEPAATTEAVVVAAPEAAPLEPMPLPEGMDAPMATEAVVAEVVEEAPVEEAAAEPVADSGNTAWIIVATALVLLMTIPGLALFYAGTRHPSDRFNHLLSHLIAHSDVDFDFRQKVHHIFCAAIQLGMAFLTTEAFDFSDGNALHTDIR